MVREMVRIDEELCNGCGLCVPGCHEGALQIIDGKARLISDLMCDGLGACIGHCRQGAITMEKREAELYSETKVMEIMVNKGKNTAEADGGGCPGSRNVEIVRKEAVTVDNANPQSELRQWPVQLHLVNPQSPYYRNADILIAADCTAFVMGDFHQRYLKGKSLAIACPKLDSNMEVYLNKITAMIDHAGVNTITVMIMQVLCCGGLLQIVKQAASAAQQRVPIKLMVVSIEGEVIKEEWQ
jgi:NAD-dependent dihydropyrimidine dehydrogenase PreA subunit